MVLGFYHSNAIQITLDSIEFLKSDRKRSGEAFPKRRYDFVGIKQALLAGRREAGPDAA